MAMLHKLIQVHKTTHHTTLFPLVTIEDLFQEADLIPKLNKKAGMSLESGTEQTTVPLTTRYSRCIECTPQCYLECYTALTATVEGQLMEGSHFHCLCMTCVQPGPTYIPTEILHYPVGQWVCQYTQAYREQVSTPSNHPDLLHFVLPLQFIVTSIVAKHTRSCTKDHFTYTHQ